MRQNHSNSWPIKLAVAPVVILKVIHSLVFYSFVSNIPVKLDKHRSFVLKIDCYFYSLINCLKAQNRKVDSIVEALRLSN